MSSERWPHVAMALESLAVGRRVPPHLEGDCYSFDDRRCLAMDDVYGTVDEVRNDFMAFLKREARRPEPTTSREAYVALVKDFCRQEYWAMHESSDYPPWTVRIVLTAETPDKRTAMYFPEPGIVEVYRQGIARPVDSQVAHAAAEASDPAYEAVFLAHELGHHLSVLKGVGSAVFNTDRPRETYREELWAWLFARPLLEERGFRAWNDFARYENEGLRGYREGLSLTCEDAGELEEQVRREFIALVPPNSGF